MTTPIFDFVKAYAESKTTRFHMPGHKGVGKLGCEQYDITEIKGADVLYSAEGIIEESENNLSSLYGSAHSFYSTEGSTLAIKAMLALVSERCVGERPLILAARNVHTAFVKAAALLDLDVEFIYPEGEGHLCECNITAEDVKAAIAKAKKKPRAVYVTSPDYLGNMLDISAISAVCRDNGLPLLVDNAHGAYLKFLPQDIHPITLGAAMCADSAHKTLPALTGGAYLHISKSFADYVPKARWALSLFASTSPSYLTLASLDLSNKRLSEDYSEGLKLVCKMISRIKETINCFGLFVEDTEPLKIVINAKRSGHCGEHIAKSLRLADIEPEFVDKDYVVLMPSIETSEGDLTKLTKALKSIGQSARKTEVTPIHFPKKHESVMTIREAVFAESESVSVENSLGRISASPTISCPPAVPIVISGECITEDDIDMLKYYGFNNVRVVIEKV